MTSPTLLFLFKAVVSGILVAAISSLAKVFPKWAALITALPIVTFLSLIWIYFENRDLKLLETYVWDVFLWTLPGLGFFIAATLLFRAEIPFGLSLFGATLSLALGVLVFYKLGWIK